MSVNQQSRYFMTLGATRISDGLSFIMDREPITFQPRSDNKRVIARVGDTWWSLAATYLGSLQNPEQFYWAICDYQPNPITDPMVPPTPGTIVFIPDEDYFISVYFSDSRRDEDAI